MLRAVYRCYKPLNWIFDRQGSVLDAGSNLYLLTLPSRHWARGVGNHFGHHFPPPCLLLTSTAPSEHTIGFVHDIMYTLEVKAMRADICGAVRRRMTMQYLL